MSPDRRIADLRRAYHDAILAEGVAEKVHAHIQGRARELNLTYGDRVVCQVLEPLFVAREHYERLLERSESLALALAELIVDLGHRPELMARLRLGDRERALIALDGGLRPHDLIGRMDALPGPDGEPTFLEYNGESPGGIAYGDCLGRVFDELELVQRLAERRPMSRRPVIPEVVRTFRAAYHRWADRMGRKTEDAPRVAIVDLADIPTLGEFELFRQNFEAQGMPCRILSPERLALVDGRLEAEGEEIDLVYRRLVTSDLLARYEPEGIIEVIARDRLAYMANGFEGYLLCHKGLFALLQDPADRPARLGARELETIDRCLPWTRLLEDRPLDGPEGEGGLSVLDHARANKNQLVLKLALGYGGRDVILGWRCSEDDWDRQLRSALASGRSWVIQRRVSIPVSEHPALIGGKVEFVLLQYDLDPYVLMGRRGHGLGVRLSSSEILNVASGAGSAVPAYVVS
ncbi:MAG: hypothetical protein H6807_16350 [Planctomycetes bacterium]|nr:hypothetical protein [Planctomycetota bacterium]